MISTLHYISQPPHLQNIQAACEAGCRWIQLRIKNATDEDIIHKATAAREICNAYGARLIINDHPHIAKAVGANGVHVGKKDMTVAAARAITGNEMIVGGTANTLQDILLHVADGASYVGLGPYRFTTTKEGLSPVLGIEGISSIMQQLKKLDIDIPVIAIGGILLEDLPSLITTGIHGIAVSGLVTHAANKQEIISSITHQFDSCNHLS